MSAGAAVTPRETADPRRRPRPWVLLVLSTAVAAAVALPLVFLLIEAHGVGTEAVTRLFWRPLTGQLLWNTARLLVVVTALCAVLGVAAAWCVERTDLPGRQVWAVLVVVPLAIPDFVVSFGWASLSTWVTGFRGAVLVMTLAVYPLVYLPAAASFRTVDPALDEVARSLGARRVARFVRVTLGQAKTAVLGGCLLVALVMLAEYGAFEILGYRTFTTEIFTESNVSYNLATACALALILVLLSVLVLGGDAFLRGGGRDRTARVGGLSQRRARRVPLGRAKVPVLAGFVALVGLAVGVPVYACIYWMVTRTSQTLQGVSLPSAALHTGLYAALAAALATAMALPVAMLASRHPGRLHRLLERSTYLVLALPGVVVGFALSYFTNQYAGGFLYQSTALLILAYALLFFPLALVGVRASVAQVPTNLEEVARSLRQSRLAVFRRVTLPLVRPGLAAAFSLVFLSVVTELTATLLLRPTGAQTLATQFWEYERNLSYGQAAPFALVIIAVAALPSVVLGRYFERLPSRAEGPSSRPEA